MPGGASIGWARAPALPRRWHVRHCPSRKSPPSIARQQGCLFVAMQVLDQVHRVIGEGVVQPSRTRKLAGRRWSKWIASPVWVVRKLPQRYGGLGADRKACICDLLDRRCRYRIQGIAPNLARAFPRGSIPKCCIGCSFSDRCEVLMWNGSRCRARLDGAMTTIWILVPHDQLYSGVEVHSDGIASHLVVRWHAGSGWLRTESHLTRRWRWRL